VQSTERCRTLAVPCLAVFANYKLFGFLNGTVKIRSYAPAYDLALPNRLDDIIVTRVHHKLIYHDLCTMRAIANMETGM
jgi:hypothetical protein